MPVTETVRGLLTGLPAGNCAKAEPGSRLYAGYHPVRREFS